MKSNSLVLINKDALCFEYLPCYGNLYWKGKTPNIDELASKGVVYKKFYTAAPSSAMSYLSMFTGKYPYQQEIGTFRPLNDYNGETLFDKATLNGFKCHIVWDEGWMSGAYRYSSCYDKTTIHPLNGLKQSVGAQFIHESKLKNNNYVAEQSQKLIDEELSEISKEDEKVFLWIHFPHVINGRTCYGADIDLFDQMVGIVRKYFNDSCIFISADHGNMNGHKGILGYGFDVYESATRIPLITPSLPNSVEPNTLMCNIDMYKIIFNEQIPVREYVFLDSAYYAQKNRNLGIVSGNYKYIFHKKSNKEELFDLELDAGEEFNLMTDKIYDEDRKLYIPSCEEYFYPRWDSIDLTRQYFRKIKDTMWREPTIRQSLMNNLKDFVRPMYVKIRRIIK